MRRTAAAPPCVTDVASVHVVEMHDALDAAAGRRRRRGGRLRATGCGLERTDVG